MNKLLFALDLSSSHQAPYKEQLQILTLTSCPAMTSYDPLGPIIFNVCTLLNYDLGIEFWMSNICFDFFNWACLQKTTKSIQYSAFDMHKYMRCRPRSLDCSNSTKVSIFTIYSVNFYE